MFHGMGMLLRNTLTKIIIMHFNIKAKQKSTQFAFKKSSENHHMFNWLSRYTNVFKKLCFIIENVGNSWALEEHTYSSWQT